MSMSLYRIFRSALAASAVSLAVAQTAPVSFEKVPEPALATLRMAKGKAISTGMVFVNGRLVSGPYVVSRYGTAIRINRDQVTGQIVPWAQFTTSAGTRPTPRPAAVQSPAPAAPAPARPQASTVDDLFDDDPPPARPAAAAPAAQTPVPGPSSAPAAPEAYGEYVDSPRSKAMLKRINDYRTDIDRTLRDGGVFFFGLRHSPVRVDARLAKELMAVLPGALRDANDARHLHDILRRNGVTYIPPEACVDLMRDRTLYLKIRDRLREIEEEQSFRKMLGGAGGGR